MYINSEEPKHSIRSQRSDDGELILVGGGSHKTGQGEDTIKHYDALIDYACETFTVEDIPYRWSTQDCMTMDALPLVGQFTSNSPNMYIATGYGKWGMTNSMASAMILRDLIVDGKKPRGQMSITLHAKHCSFAKNFVVRILMWQKTN